MPRKKKIESKKNVTKREIKSYPNGLTSESARKAYDEYLALEKRIEEHPKRYYKTQDSSGNEIVIDCKNAPFTIKKQTKLLPKEEESKVMDVWREINQLKIDRGQITKKFPEIGEYTRSKTAIGVLDARRTEILELFGSWKRVDEIRSYINQEYKMKVSTQMLKKFAIANQDKIKELRNEWVDSYADFDVAQKRGRVERLAYIVKTQTDKYQQTKYKAEHSREIRAALEQLRKEVEGDEIKLTVSGEIDVRQTLLVNQSIDEITSRVNINALIVALVASKRGLDPTKFMNKLANGYYSSFTGFKGKMDENELHNEIQYPSKLIYNWTEIDKKNKESNQEDYVEYTDVNQEDPVRKKLMEKLKQKQLKKK